MRDLLVDGIPWFPQQYAEVYYWLKGLTSLLATVLVIAHMSTAFRDEFMSLGRRLRYYCLLIAGVVLTGASVEQVDQTVPVNYRNLGGMILAASIVFAMVVSIAESRRETTR